ncbi:MAG: type II toxin-antitoxin system VapC family toxin [Chloroflexi bacterium]|nr:type II toxin-antitoxin system VapC family toxin [Chloroflexota bacterium]
MNVVDSSGWLEYIANEDNAPFFKPAILDLERLIVPTICLYEVYKRMAVQRGQESALQSVGVLFRGMVIDITSELALEAANLSLEHKLPMADSIILATAHAYDATLWTQDEHFKDMDGVKYIEKKTTP